MWQNIEAVCKDLFKCQGRVSPCRPVKYIIKPKSAFVAPCMRDILFCKRWCNPSEFKRASKSKKKLNTPSENNLAQQLFQQTPVQWKEECVQCVCAWVGLPCFVVRKEKAEGDHYRGKKSLQSPLEYHNHSSLLLYTEESIVSNNSLCSVKNIQYLKSQFTETSWPFDPFHHYFLSLYSTMFTSWTSIISWQQLISFPDSCRLKSCLQTFWPASW